MDRLSRHRITLTITLDVDGVDQADAVNVARQALDEALPGGALRTRTYAGKPRTATVVSIAAGLQR